MGINYENDRNSYIRLVYFQSTQNNILRIKEINYFA